MGADALTLGGLEDRLADVYNRDRVSVSDFDKDIDWESAHLTRNSLRYVQILALWISSWMLLARVEA